MVQALSVFGCGAIRPRGRPERARLGCPLAPPLTLKVGCNNPRPCSCGKTLKRCCGEVASRRAFIDQVLWPEFSELDQALQLHPHEVTLRVIREEVYSDTSDAQEIPEALPPQ